MIVELINAKTGETILLSEFPALVGRDCRVNAVIHDPQVARYHCMIDKAKGGGLVVWDLGTGMCLEVNSRPARRSYLRPGDELRLGTTRLRIEYSTTQHSFVGVFQDAEMSLPTG
jgi:pSer/pThr/pTyr-binding forkhead associated (FHA) protein